MEQPKIDKPARRQLVVILLISAVSLFGSYGLFWIAKAGLGWGTTNNGEFVSPPLTTAEIGWRAEDNIELLQDNLWWLWLKTDQCARTCQTAMENLKATHILLNRDAERLRIGVTTAGGAEAETVQLLKVAVQKNDLVDGIYIIDPLGNFVFFYPMDTPPKEILADLKRLLKVSQIG